MNQSILINDDIQWDVQQNRVSFTAINAGSIVSCHLSKHYLLKKGMDESIEPAAILEFCSLIEFDIEEDACQAINDEQLSDEGVLILN